MILFANGCSMTWGGGLEPYLKSNNDVTLPDQRLKLLWPHHLGKLLNADEVINISEGCGSNQRIVRTTHDWFLNEYKNEPTIAVIQITDPARYEYYLTDNFEDFTNDQLNWVKLTPSAYIAPGPPFNDTTLVNMKKERDSRMSTYTLLEGMYKIISDCSALAHLFEKHNVEYYFFGGYFNRINIDYPIRYKNYMTNLHYMDLAWNSFDPVSKDDMHPSLLGHQQIAELIYQIIRPKHVI